MDLDLAFAAVLSRLYALIMTSLSPLVGVNLFQSAFTQWCPKMAILHKAGVSG